MKRLFILFPAFIFFLGAGCNEYNSINSNELLDTNGDESLNENQTSEESRSATADWILYDHKYFTVKVPPDFRIDDTTYSDKIYFYGPEDKDRFSFWVSPLGHGGPGACFSVAEQSTTITWDGFIGVREECPGAVTYLFNEKTEPSKQIPKGEVAFFELWFEFESGENDETLIGNVLSTLIVK